MDFAGFYLHFLCQPKNGVEDADIICISNCKQNSYKYDRISIPGSEFARKCSIQSLLSPMWIIVDRRWAILDGGGGPMRDGLEKWYWRHSRRGIHVELRTNDECIPIRWNPQWLFFLAGAETCAIILVENALKWKNSKERFNCELLCSVDAKLNDKGLGSLIEWSKLNNFFFRIPATPKIKCWLRHCMSLSQTSKLVLWTKFIMTIIDGNKTV